MINFKWYTFQELTVQQLYAILTLRSEVFVVEQACLFLDPDNRDQSAIHLLGLVDSKLTAYLRLFLPTDSKKYLVFGRIVTNPLTRQHGYGKKLMEELLFYCNQHYSGVTIKCSAQLYLQKFYENFGFKPVSKIYEEDGMPHIAMQLDYR